MRGKVAAISVSNKKGQKKENVSLVDLKEGFGILGDAHAGSDRQVSLLAIESIEKMRQKGLEVNPGDFAENITTKGIDLIKLSISDKVRIGRTVILEICQIGKECHSRCDIYYRAGDCVMPKEGVFARILKGGKIISGDKVEVA